MDHQESMDLVREIEEIEALIAQWQGVDDFETRWAIYLLEYCLERRRAQLRRCLH